MRNKPDRTQSRRAARRAKRRKVTDLPDLDVLLADLRKDQP